MLLGLLLLLAGPAPAETIARASLPGWVTSVPVPEPNPDRLADAQDGIYDLVYDHQIRVDPDRSLLVIRRVVKVLDRAGIDKVAKQSFDFDPSYQRVILYRFTLTRAGVTTDRLASADVEVLRREEKLDDNVITGEKTVSVRLRDVRADDIVDFSYGIEERSIFWPGQWFDSFDASWSVPIGVAHLRIDYAGTMPIVFTTTKARPDPVQGQAGGRRWLDWLAHDPAPVSGEENLPPGYSMWGSISGSTMADWVAVVRWSVPHYAGKDSLPPGFAAEVDAIGRASADPAVRTVRVLRLVQSAVRYTSISIGAGGWVPRSPAETLTNGWGDCKDKAVLLVAALHRLGIDAAPALTDMDNGAALPRGLPSPFLFNHVVVAVRIGGKTWWLDPTLDPQGGALKDLAPLDYGFALPIRPGQTALEAIPKTLPARPTYAVVETYHVPDDRGAPLTLDVVTTYTRGAADAMRSKLEGQTQAALAKTYLDFYLGSYPGLETVRPIRITDDLETGRLTVVEAYRLPPAARTANGLDSQFPVYASTLDSAYDKPAKGDRSAPLWLDFAGWRTHRVIVETPGRRPPLPDAERIDNAAFDYALAPRRDGDRLIIDWHLRAKAHEVAPADLDRFRDDLAASEATRSVDLDLTSRAGGGMGKAAVPRAVGLVLTMTIGLVVGVIGIRRAFRNDRAQAGSRLWAPVGLVKFVLLSLASLGAYQWLWTWRCWRWAKAQQGEDIIPFARALFGQIFLWPLFARANRRAQPPLPAWLGALAAIAYVLLVVFAVSAKYWAPGPWISVAVSPFYVAVHLPALIAVNRANRGNGAEAAASGFDGLHLIAVITGLAFLVLMVSN